jgi:FkbM family methyltransferase
MKENKFYGQFMTDKHIKEYFPKEYKGNCIEIGAVDGLFISNTLHFEQIGWNVLCIEPIPLYYEKLSKNRSLTLNYAITDKNIDNEPFTLVTMNTENKSSISGLKIDDRLIESHISLGLEPKKETIYVNCRRLDWCIENYFNYETIDFISIDTEGNELDVLKSFDINQYNTKLLVIENNFNESEIENYLNDLGWIKDKRVEVNDFYIKKIK